MTRFKVPVWRDEFLEDGNSFAQIIQWCRDNFESGWFYDINGNFFFSNDSDAIMFRMKWNALPVAN